MTAEPAAPNTFEAQLRQARAGLDAAREAAQESEARAGDLYTELLRSQAEARAAMLESDSLLEGLRVLTEALDIEQILTGLLSVLRGVLAFEHALVLMGRGDDDGASLKVVAASDARFAEGWWRPGELFRRVLDGEIVACPDVRQIPEWQAQEAPLREGVASALHASIGPPGVAAMLICTHTRRGYFTKRHVALAGRFVALAAQALRNANLYASLRQERDRLEERVERRTAELREQRDFAMQVMTNIAQGLAVADEHGRFEYVNPAFARLLGYEPAEMLGLTPFDVTLPDDHHVLRAAQYRRSGGATDTYETRLRGADDRIIYAMVTAAPRLRAGAPAGTISVITDLTERSRAEAALRRAKELAEQAAEAKAGFLASMSHEIRTPLNAVIGLTGLLLETELGPVQRDYAATVRNSGQVLLSIINDILDYSKFEAGHLELERQAFALRRFLQETTDLLRNEAREKGLALRLVVAEEAPTYVVGDVTRLRQVLVNLLSNAIKFTERGGVTVALASAPEPDGRRRLHFEVSDTGIGMSPDRIDRLFQPFSQLDASTTRKYGGTGLGLAICRQLVEAMGGRIWVESEPGAGAAFHFTILTQEARAEDLPRTGTLLPLPALPAALPPLRLLVAEDNAVNQKVALHMLARLGYRADVVGNGEEALRALRRQPYDVVLMDEQMPEMDGVTATAAILAEWPPGRRPRVVAMTASALEGDRERLLAAGMDDYISKPVLIEELAAALIRAGAAGSVPAGPVPGEADAGATAVDEAAFVERLGEDGRMLLAQLVPLFLAEADEWLPQLRAALAADDAELVRQAAHRLKGSAADVAAVPFARTAAALEALARTGDLSGAPALVESVARELERVRAWPASRAAQAATAGAGDGVQPGLE